MMTALPINKYTPGNFFPSKVTRILSFLAGHDTIKMDIIILATTMNKDSSYNFLLKVNFLLIQI